MNPKAHCPRDLRPRVRGPFFAFNVFGFIDLLAETPSLPRKVREPRRDSERTPRFENK